MSILGSSSTGGDGVNKPLFHEFKKQASFFLKEKIKTARLALTDVTATQLLAEEATNGNPGGPDARTLKMISRSAFEVDEYWRVVEILHKRLARFDRRNWRESYKALLVLEHLMTHGPESVAEEFQTDRDVIREMESFQHIDEKGFNWGMNVRKKAERILNLLEKGPLLKEERDRARKVSRGIQGFGSFCHRTPSREEVLQESSLKTFDRCNSQCTDPANQEDFFPALNDDSKTKTKLEKPVPAITSRKEILGESSSARADSKENWAPSKENLLSERDVDSWICKGESNPLLNERKDASRIDMSVEDHHPFADAEHLTTASLL